MGVSMALKPPCSIWSCPTAGPVISFETVDDKVTDLTINAPLITAICARRIVNPTQGGNGLSNERLKRDSDTAMVTVYPAVSNPVVSQYYVIAKLSYDDSSKSLFVRSQKFTLYSIFITALNIFPNSFFAIKLLTTNKAKRTTLSNELTQRQRC